MKKFEPDGTGPLDLEGDLASLRGDSARMVAHWSAPVKTAPPPVSPSLIQGVTVPYASVRLLDAIADYGD